MFLTRLPSISYSFAEKWFREWLMSAHEYLFIIFHYIINCRSQESYLLPPAYLPLNPSHVNHFFVRKPQPLPRCSWKKAKNSLLINKTTEFLFMTFTKVSALLLVSKNILFRSRSPVCVCCCHVEVFCSTVLDYLDLLVAADAASLSSSLHQHPSSDINFITLVACEKTKMNMNEWHTRFQVWGKELLLLCCKEEGVKWREFIKILQ